MAATYDTIGDGYARLRRSDPRIAAQINAALGEARTVLNVGAGSGSYEPANRTVTALEPSAEMIAQRAPGTATVVQGHAENLPFDDNAFDAVMAVLTIHHWTDQARGLAEMARVSRGRIVVLTYDPAFRDFWLFDYFPALVTLDEAQMPPLPFFTEILGPVNIAPVPIPHDCVDGFLSAYWRRPVAYLDETNRKAMSSFWKIGDTTDGIRRLSADLANGTWQGKYGALLELETRDCGYRLITSG